MLTPAQNQFQELRKKGLRAAIFEGMWLEPRGCFVFELGERVQAATYTGGLCGFKSYEGVEHFYEIKKMYEFEGRAAQPHIEPAESTNNTPITSSVAPAEYTKKILEIKELIAAGETYQVNYSIPFAVSAENRDPFEIYCALTRMNPSPYMCFIEADAGALISNSPECLMKLSADGNIKTVPIKGTLPRGTTSGQDAQNEAVLLASEKNKAELAMIVDLERNDLGKVCVPGSVQVQREEVARDYRRIEKYSHVMHTVSVVEGRLAPDKNWRDALNALFPGGSVTGCPKIRTMEIIKRLEDAPRGIYCGSAGFVLPGSDGVRLSDGVDTTATFNILIRSLWFDRATQKVTFRSGGGIVADSNPEDEFKELMHKAAALSVTLNVK